MSARLPPHRHRNRQNSLWFKSKTCILIQTPAQTRLIQSTRAPSSSGCRFVLCRARVTRATSRCLHARFTHVRLDWRVDAALLVGAVPRSPQQNRLPVANFRRAARCNHPAQCAQIALQQWKRRWQYHRPSNTGHVRPNSLCGNSRVPLCRGLQELRRVAKKLLACRSLRITQPPYHLLHTPDRSQARQPRSMSRRRAADTVYTTRSRAPAGQLALATGEFAIKTNLIISDCGAVSQAYPCAPASNDNPTRIAAAGRSRW